MLKYLIILLDDTSVSYCHYSNDNSKPRLIELDVLKNALFWSMKENLSVQFVYPYYELPEDYKELISGVDHTDIVSSVCEDVNLKKYADIVVFDSWNAINHYQFSLDKSYVIRTTFADLFMNESIFYTVLPNVSRLNVVISDIENFDAENESKYSQLLEKLIGKISQEYENDHGVQVNIITDRMMLDSMNNCRAGEEAITLAPDGKFYICPGFYHDNSCPVGDVKKGLSIKNQQLYSLDHAPICRICDAWHCKRCIWQNKNATSEVNTPGREQCVISHIERNASRKLLDKIREIGMFLPDKDIPVIDYMDPFDNIRR